ncbi:hypothetical protein [Thaumasiovibrio subtropicus]|uniref:hypothetical protein n=1 Tax=Thaumasiovibrio subtropicus TaxID=1891207 RepID=UPI000B363C45|nr:hypothetical protein [Thaumasiovibrio subtropicus]
MSRASWLLVISVFLLGCESAEVVEEQHYLRLLKEMRSQHDGIWPLYPEYMRHSTSEPAVGAMLAFIKRDVDGRAELMAMQFPSLQTSPLISADVVPHMVMNSPEDVRYSDDGRFVFVTQKTIEHAEEGYACRVYDRYSNEVGMAVLEGSCIGLSDSVDVVFDAQQKLASLYQPSRFDGLAVLENGISVSKTGFRVVSNQGVDSPYGAMDYAIKMEQGFATEVSVFIAPKQRYEGWLASNMPAMPTYSQIEKSESLADKDSEHYFKWGMMAAYIFDEVL